MSAVWRQVTTNNQSSPLEPTGDAPWSQPSAVPPPSAHTPPTPTTASTPNEPVEELTPAGVGGFPADFDPASVPIFPVLTLEVHAPTAHGCQWSASLQGTPLPATPLTREAAVESVIRAACAHIAERGWDACRASAVLITPGEAPRRHSLILGPHGERFDCDAVASPDAKPRRRKLVVVGSILGALVAVTAIGITAILPHEPPQTQAQLPAPVAPPAPVAAQFPGQAPAGFSPLARWSSDALLTHSVAAAGGVVAVAPRTGGIAVLGADHGRPVATVTTRGSVQAGPWLIQWPSRGPVAVWREEGRLAWISLGGHDYTPTYAETGSQANNLSVSSSGLAWRESPTRIMVLTPSGPEARTVAADTFIANVDESRLTTVDALGQVYETAATFPHASPALTPAGGPGRLEGVIAVTPTTLVTLWRDQERSAIAFYRRGALAYPDSLVPVVNGGQAAVIASDLSSTSAEETSLGPGWYVTGTYVMNAETRMVVSQRDLGESATLTAAHQRTIWASAPDAAMRMELPAGEQLRQARPQRAAGPVALLPTGESLVFGQDRRLYSLPTA